MLPKAISGDSSQLRSIKMVFHGVVGLWLERGIRGNELLTFPTYVSWRNESQVSRPFRYTRPAAAQTCSDTGSDCSFHHQFDLQLQVSIRLLAVTALHRSQLEF